MSLKLMELPGLISKFIKNPASFLKPFEIDVCNFFKKFEKPKGKVFVIIVDDAFENDELKLYVSLMDLNNELSDTVFQSIIPIEIDGMQNIQIDLKKLIVNKIMNNGKSN